MKYDPENGWSCPPREEWPDIAPIMCGDAVILMLMAGDLVFLVARSHEGGQVPGLYVPCNDVFWWATADAEPAPGVGWGRHHNDETIALYNECRTGPWGAARWCCLKRGMRPQPPIEELMRGAGAWDERLEALPVRDPKGCG